MRMTSNLSALLLAQKSFIFHRLGCRGNWPDIELRRLLRCAFDAKGFGKRFCWSDEGLQIARVETTGTRRAAAEIGLALTAQSLMLKHRLTNRKARPR